MENKMETTILYGLYRIRELLPTRESRGKPRDRLSFSKQYGSR